MPKERFYLPKELSEHQEVLIEGPELHHLATVMRLTVGDTIELINGQGSYGIGKIVSVNKKQAILFIETLNKQEKPTSEIIIAQALPRLSRLDFIIEKATELGVTSLWLFPGENSEKKELSPNQLARIQHLLIAASKQSGRLFLPEVLLKPPLAKWTPTAMPFFYGSLAPGAPLFRKVLQERPLNKVVFCVGPESGFTHNEELILKKIRGIGVNLHPNILRTDTAAITAAVLISSYIVD